VRLSEARLGKKSQVYFSHLFTRRLKPATHIREVYSSESKQKGTVLANNVILASSAATQQCRLNS
jgi:hypothetical protein